VSVELASARSTHQRTAATPTPRPLPGIRAVALAWVALSLLYGATFGSMVDVWLRSATFAHGFVIAPIAAWLVWRRRWQLRQLPVRPAPLLLPVLAGLGAVWLLADLANVQVVQQLSVVLMAIVTVVAVLGVRLGRAMAFPLAYLLLAVPFGEVLIAPLIDFTAGFCVVILQLLNIPVFRENNYLTLATGTWSVVEACSGLRYLIASFAMGTVYAYLTYRSAWRRLAFGVVAVLLPVLANGLRAAMIILLGHWSDMTMAQGVDHLIYGWLFFGLVTLLLFWIGAYWRQAEVPFVPLVPAQRPLVPPPAAALARLVATTAAVIAISAVWPALALLAVVRGPVPDAPTPVLHLASPPAPWIASAMAPADWQVPHLGRPARWATRYMDPASGRTVSLQLTWYRHQRRHDELLAPVQRVVAPGLPRWHTTPLGRRRIALAGRHLDVDQTIEQSATVKLLVWRWYRQQDVDTASAVQLKWLTAKNKLLGRDDSAAEIVVACAYDDDAAPAAQAMTALLQSMLPAIEQGLHHVATR